MHFNLVEEDKPQDAKLPMYLQFTQVRQQRPQNKRIIREKLQKQLKYLSSNVKSLQRQQQRQLKYLDKLNQKAFNDIKHHVIKQKQTLFKMVSQRNLQKFSRQQRLQRLRKLQQNQLKQLSLLNKKIAQQKYKQQQIAKLKQLRQTNQAYSKAKSQQSLFLNQIRRIKVQKQFDTAQQKKLQFQFQKIKKVGLFKQSKQVLKGQFDRTKAIQQIKYLRGKSQQLLRRLEQLYKKQQVTRKMIQITHKSDKQELARDWMQDSTSILGQNQIVQMTLQNLIKNMKQQTQ